MLKWLVRTRLKTVFSIVGNLIGGDVVGVDVGEASNDHLRDLPVSGGGNCFSHSP